MPKKIYCSVNGHTKQFKKIYGSLNGVTKELKKVYGSVNGLTKQIYPDRLPRPTFGRVYYKETSTSTEIKHVDLLSVAEFNSLAGNISSPYSIWSTTVGEEEITVYNAASVNFIVGVEVGENITSLPTAFLSRCSNLEFLENYSHITRIPNGFLYYCASFNQPLELSPNLTYIDQNFLRECSSFNQPINLPQTITTIRPFFLTNCRSFVGPLNVGAQPCYLDIRSQETLGVTLTTVPAYTSGVKIAGENRAEWLSLLPNSSRPTYYRKLVNAGY